MSFSNATRGSDGIAFTPADLSRLIFLDYKHEAPGGAHANLSSITVVRTAIVVALKFFPGLESNRLTQRDRYFFACARVAPDTALAWLHDEYAKAAQFDPIATRQRVLHRTEERFNRLFGFQLWNSRLVGKSVDDIEFNHERDLQLGERFADSQVGKVFSLMRGDNRKHNAACQAFAVRTGNTRRRQLIVDSHRMV